MADNYGPSIFVEGVTGFVSVRAGQDKFFQISVLNKDKDGNKSNVYVDCTSTEKAGKPKDGQRVKAKGFICYKESGNPKYPGIKYSLKVTEFEVLSEGKPRAGAAPAPAAVRPPPDPFADAAGAEDLDIPF